MNKKRHHQNRKKAKNRLSWHHRRCRSNGGASTPENLSRVPALQHEMWHALFSNECAERIAEIINLVWLDPEWELVAIKKPST